MVQWQTIHIIPRKWPSLIKVLLSHTIPEVIQPILQRTTAFVACEAVDVFYDISSGYNLLLRLLIYWVNVLNGCGRWI